MFAQHAIREGLDERTLSGEEIQAGGSLCRIVQRLTNRTKIGMAFDLPGMKGGCRFDHSTEIWL